MKLQSVRQKKEPTRIKGVQFRMLPEDFVRMQRCAMDNAMSVAEFCESAVLHVINSLDKDRK